jgi:hypothetical protein
MEIVDFGRRKKGNLGANFLLIIHPHKSILQLVVISSQSNKPLDNTRNLLKDVMRRSSQKVPI